MLYLSDYLNFAVLSTTLMNGLQPVMYMLGVTNSNQNFFVYKFHLYDIINI